MPHCGVQVIVVPADQRSESLVEARELCGESATVMLASRRPDGGRREGFDVRVTPYRALETTVVRSTGNETAHRAQERRIDANGGDHQRQQFLDAAGARRA